MKDQLRIRFRVPSTDRPAILAALPAVAAMSLITLSGTNASAAVSLTYDADTATTGAQDGAGSGWNVVANPSNWYNGSSDVQWSTANSTADTAIFGAATAGTGGTVTVGTVTVGTIIFAPQTTTGYTLATGTITLGGAAAITTTNSVNSAISAKISGTAGLNFTGVLNSQVGVTLSGANDYMGITTLSTGGRLTTSSTTAFGSNAGASATALGTNYTQINALTTVGQTVSTSEAFLINGSGSVASGNPAGAMRLSNGVTLSSLVQLGSNAVITGNFGTNTASGTVDLQGNTLGVGNGSNGITLTISGVLNGTSASILDVGAGGGTNVVNLTNVANTFSGTTRVNASSGTSAVGLGNDTALGTSTLVFAGGGVQSTDATGHTIANTIGTFAGNAIFGQTATQTGTLNFTYSTAPVSLGGTRTFTTNVNTTFANVFSGSGNGLTKSGAATLFLNSANTFTGPMNIAAGTLPVSTLSSGGLPSTIGQSTNVAANLVFSGGTLSYTGATAQTTDRLFTVAGSTVATASTIDASGSVPAATLTFSNAGANASTASGTRVGTTTPLSATVTGLVSTADLQVGATVTGSNIPANTTIVSISPTSITLSNAATGAGAATSTFTIGSVNRTLVLTGTNTGTNMIVGALSDPATFTGTPAATLSLAKTGGGTWLLSGSNTYTGATTVSAGTLIAGNNVLTSGAGAFGNSASAIALGDTASVTNNSSPSLLTGGAFSVGRDITTGATGSSGAYAIGGNVNAASTFSGTVTLNRNLAVSQVATTSNNALALTGNITSGITGTQTLAFTNAGTVNQSIGAIGGGTGTIAVTKSGAGKTTLSGSNTYAGGTTITAGTLLTNGTGSLGTGTTTVTGTGVLAGTGSTGGPVVVGNGTANNGKISAGSGIDPVNDSVGTLTTGRQTWKTGGSYSIKFASPISSDLLNIVTVGAIAGTLDLSSASGLSAGGFTLAVLNKVTGAFAANGSYKFASAGSILDNTNTTAYAGENLTNLFVLTVDNTLISSSDYTVTAARPDGSGSAGDLYLNYTPTPEPTTAALFGLGGSVLIGRRRRAGRDAALPLN